MTRPDANTIRFVKSLLKGAVARVSADRVETSDGRVLEAAQIAVLAREEVVIVEVSACRAGSNAPQWLRRQVVEADGAAARQDAGGTAMKAASSARPDGVLGRLAQPGAEGEAFLRPHHVEAGERLARLVERAQLQPRLTMSYSAERVAGGGGATRAGEMSDIAADARRQLAELHRLLPRDCADVVLEVCGLGRGLQQVEADRRWPRRSAKLVLRIGLDRLAEIYGLTESTSGTETRRRRSWMEGCRPSMFAGD